MDIGTVSQLIGSLGFPIVACYALYKQLNKQADLHKEETMQLTEAVNNNTIVMTKLVDKLGGIEDDDNNE